MSTKTISIDLGAYRCLKHVQRKNESFSQVIRRTVRQPMTLKELRNWFAKVETLGTDPAFGQAVERQIQSRGRRSRAEG